MEKAEIVPSPRSVAYRNFPVGSTTTFEGPVPEKNGEFCIKPSAPVVASIVNPATKLYQSWGGPSKATYRNLPSGDTARPSGPGFAPDRLAKGEPGIGVRAPVVEEIV